jgi:hypothetical protein
MFLMLEESWNAYVLDAGGIMESFRGEVDVCS